MGKRGHAAKFVVRLTPEGHARWSLRLLEKHVVELGIVETASDTTIHRVLKKRAQTSPKPLLGDSPQGQCRLCFRDGGRARCLHPPTGPEMTSRLSERDFQTTKRNFHLITRPFSRLTH